MKEHVHLLIDGSYFSSDICLVIYRNNDIKCTQLYRLSNSEAFEEMKEDLENIKSLGINIRSITCDGHRALLKAIRSVFKNEIIIQRCVVHVQRSARLWLTQLPKSIPGQELLKIAYEISQIKTEYDRQVWMRKLYDWDLNHQIFLKQRSVNQLTGRSWYTHKVVRRIRHLLIKSFPDMFHYISNPAIPKSTNGLESFFGHLKDNLSIHRGLTMKNRRNFIKWYLHFKNEFSKPLETQPIKEKGESN